MYNGRNKNRSKSLKNTKDLVSRDNLSKQMKPIESLDSTRLKFRIYEIESKALIKDLKQ